MAAGDAQLSTELAAHLETCGTAILSIRRNPASSARSILDCKSSSIGICRVPSCRVCKLEWNASSTQARPGFWIGVYAAAAAVLLVLVLSFIRNHPRSTTTLRSASEPIGRRFRCSRSLAQGRKSSEINGPFAAPNRKTRPFRSRRPRLLTSPPRSSYWQEEREAFARFVAVLPMQNEVAVALTHPAPSKPDPPVQIALLQIRVRGSRAVGRDDR